jgi:hypothetical protein
MADCIVTVCCLDDLNQERIDANAARQLFGSLQVNRMRLALGASSGPSISKLCRLLQVISQTLQPPCEEVEVLLNATSRALELWLGIVREELGRPHDAEALIDVIGVACAQYSDGSGPVTEQAVRLLFSGFPSEPFAHGLGVAGLRAALRMRRVLKHLRQGLRRKSAAPCGGLENAIKATAVAVRDTVRDAQNVDELCHAVYAVCCEYEDGSGLIDASSTRSLFEDFPVEHFLSILSQSDPQSRRKMAGTLQKIALTVGYPRCEGLESLRRVIPS